METEKMTQKQVLAENRPFIGIIGGSLIGGILAGMIGSLIGALIGLVGTLFYNKIEKQT